MRTEVIGNATFRMNDDIEGNSAISTLCWNCSREIAYYDETCPYCWVTNANVNLGKAQKEALSDETP